MEHEKPVERHYLERVIGDAHDPLWLLRYGNRVSAPTPLTEGTQLNLLESSLQPGQKFGEAAPYGETSGK